MEISFDVTLSLNRASSFTAARSINLKIIIEDLINIKNFKFSKYHKISKSFTSENDHTQILFSASNSAQRIHTVFQYLLHPPADP